MEPYAAAPKNAAPPARGTWRRRWTRWLGRWLLCLGFIAAGAYAAQRKIIFYNWGPAVPFPPRRHVDVENVRIDVFDGVRLHAYWIPCPPEYASPIPGVRPCVLFFHGNAGTVERYRWVGARWQDALGADLLLIDYRGYGKSTGTPTEAGVLADARAAYDWLITDRKIPPERIVIVGQSLGGGVACALAREVPHQFLVLESTFSSLPDVVDELLPLTGAGRWLWDAFPSAERLRGYSRPCFISHGTSDWLIHHRHSERLRGAVSGPATLRLYKGMRHMDRRPPEYEAELREFAMKNWTTDRKNVDRPNNAP